MPTKREIRDVTVRGVRVRAVHAGNEDRPALLLVHGFLVTHAEWDDVIDDLAERFYVVVPDLPGFGDSEKPSPSRYAYGIDAFAEAMADLLAASGLSRVSVVGHSMGGAVALTLASQHSELVDKLVLVDPLIYPFPMTLKARLPLYPIVGPFIFKQLYGRSLFRAYFRDDVFSNGGRGFNSARVDEYFDRFNAPSARESAYATLRAMLDTRLVIARLGRVRSQTLVVWGREDKLFPVTLSTRLVREIAGARLEVLESGHSPAEELPAQFLATVTEFLEGKR